MDILRRRLVLAAPAVPVAAFAFVGAAPEIDDLLDRFFAAYAAMDVDGLAALLAPDVLFEDPTFRLRREGRDAVRRMMLDTRARYSAVSVTCHNRVVAGDRAATEQTVTATVRATDGPDRRVAVRGASFFAVSGGLIHRWTDYVDYQTFSEQTR